MVFCPRCGKENVVDVLCADCLRETQPLLLGHKDLTLTICPRCKSTLHQGRWGPYNDINKLIAKHVKGRLSFDANKLIEHVVVLDEFDLQDIWDKKVRPKSIVVAVTGKVTDGSDTYTEEYELPFAIKKELCKQCAQQSSQYFEGIIQVRNTKQEVEQFIHNRIESMDNVSITKAEHSKESTDLYVTDQKAIQLIGNDVVSKFGAEMKITSKLVTKDKNTGKDLYRVTVLLRLPKFDIGDVISYEGHLIRVGKLSKHIGGYDLIKDKHTQFAVNNYDDIHVHTQHQTTVLTIHPDLTVMDVETFQPLRVQNQRFHEEYRIGEKVAYVNHRGKSYLVHKKEVRTP